MSLHATGHEAPTSARMTAAVIDSVGANTRFRSAILCLPEPVSSEVLVKVRAASINSIDSATLHGHGVSGLIASFPYVLGADFSGTVVSTPYAAHPLKEGDEVFGALSLPRAAGAFAEYVAVPTLQLAKSPASLTAVEMAAVPLAALTAWGMVVEIGRAHEGQRVLVHGACTGAGHFAVQLAAYFGAQVVATAPERSLGWVRELGAHQVIEENSAQIDDQLAPVDVVIDVSGSPTVTSARRWAQTLRPAGLYVTEAPESWPGMASECRAEGIRATGFRPAPDGSTLAIIARLIESGDLKVHVQRVYPLSAIDDALAAAAHPNLRGKIVVEVTPSRAANPSS